MPLMFHGKSVEKWHPINMVPFLTLFFWTDAL